MGAACACLALLAGCDFAPKFAKPLVEIPAFFKERPPAQEKPAPGWETATPGDAMPRGSWWQTFHDPELNSLEEGATASNQSIAAATASFLSARALVKQARSQYYPTVTTSPSVTRSRLSPVSNAAPAPFTVTEYSLPFDASWELDFWGRIRNTVKASSMEAQATRADLENVRLTVQAEVAADYFQLRSLDSQKQILGAAALADEESLKLARVQLGAGLADGQDVAQAETQLETARAQMTDVGILRAQLEHAIATLLGRPASSFSIAVQPLATQPAAIPAGLPSQLLERRPDIAAAERRVAEANAQIGVARAAYFPTVTLGGSGGSQSSSLANLGSGPSLVWSVGTTLAQTLFDGGKRRAVTEQARAAYLGTVANYRQTVLSAFQEVEDNLSNLRILSRELQQQNAVVEASQRYLTLANARYKSGVDTYLNVIVAQTTLLGNQRTAATLRMQQMTANVQLIKALGGGWKMRPVTS